LLSFLADVEIPLDSGDFCVVSRRFLDELNRLPERRRFQRGLRAWLGFRQVGLEYERQARALGQPKYTLAKLINLGLDGIVNFSTRPMRLLMMLGIGLGAAAFALSLAVLAIYVANITLWGYNARQTQGWTSLILAIFFLSGTQLFGLGVLGEYIGRIFEEAKGRPTYVVEERLGSRGGDESA
jgi:dolichol-phosphate mannosyltransferase